MLVARSRILYRDLLYRGLSTASSNKVSILNHSLTFVEEHGWGGDALTRGAVSAGFPPTAHAMVFEEGESSLSAGGGEIALVNHFMGECNSQLREKVADRVRSGLWDEEGVSSLERYKAAIRIRLNMNAPYVKCDRWHEAMAVGALPSNALSTAKFLNELTEIICEAGKSGSQAAGGQGATLENNAVATYGERAAVGAVYLSTELYMLSDKSEDFAGTWAFLDSRMGEIGTVGETVAGRANPSDAVVAAGAGAAAVGGALVSLAGPAAVGLVGALGAGGGSLLPSLLNTLNGMAGTSANESQGGTANFTSKTQDSQYNEWVEEENDGGTDEQKDKQRRTKSELNWDAGAVFPK
mmetsp:Transcript_12086/g.24696  ORF Transcript_12086/g.24696 Transcript_12086/m.24696 type:complete len:353 (+) Transcript_12086:1-1059(+)